MLKPIKVRALPGYRLEIEYDDGVKGEVDLEHLAGKGVFAVWNDYDAFDKVYIGEYGQIAWSDEIDLAPMHSISRSQANPPSSSFHH
jgi:hypothetical protein